MVFRKVVETLRCAKVKNKSKKESTKKCNVGLLHSTKKMPYILTLEGLGLLGVVPCKNELRVGCLAETKSARQLCLCPGHLNRLFKVLDRLINLALLEKQLSKGGNGNVALGISYCG